MSKKSIDFDDKSNDKSNFYKNRKLFKIDPKDFNKILVSEKQPYGTKKSKNTLLGMMIIMFLDYYV